MLNMKRLFFPLLLLISLWSSSVAQVRVDDELLYWSFRPKAFPALDVPLLSDFRLACLPSETDSFFAVRRRSTVVLVNGSARKVSFPLLEVPEYHLAGGFLLRFSLRSVFRPDSSVVQSVWIRGAGHRCSLSVDGFVARCEVDGVVKEVPYPLYNRSFDVHRFNGAIVRDGQRLFFVLDSFIIAKIRAKSFSWGALGVSLSPKSRLTIKAVMLDADLPSE